MAAVTVPGKPQAKQRPRVGKGGKVYTPKETVEYERLVAACWRTTGQPPIPKGTAVSVAIEVYPDRIEVAVCALEGAKATARADLDNIAKSVLDGLNGVAFEDDRQVARLIVERLIDPDN